MGGKRSAKSKGPGKGAPSRKAGDKCPQCNAPLPDSDRYCLTCRQDVGAPNVRSAGCQSERSALKRRFEQAKKKARSRRLAHEFNNCLDALAKGSGVVIAMPASVAKSLAEDPRQLYANLEKLLGAGIRRPPASQDDRHRCAVAGLLFGSYAAKVVYGALSLNDQGLPTYGAVFCRLRNVAIQDRTSFLEENSYTFVERHGLRPGATIPEGYRAVWDNRHQLAMAKITDDLTAAQGTSAWQNMLLRSDGTNRANDDFIEAHIYECFDIAAVEQMAVYSKKRLSRSEKLDARLAIETFQKRA